MSWCRRARGKQSQASRWGHGDEWGIIRGSAALVPKDEKTEHVRRIFSTQTRMIIPGSKGHSDSTRVHGPHGLACMATLMREMLEQAKDLPLPRASRKLGRRKSAFAALEGALGHADLSLGASRRCVVRHLAWIARIGAEEDVAQRAYAVGRGQPVLAGATRVQRTIGVGAAAAGDAGRVEEAESAGRHAGRDRGPGGGLGRAIRVGAALVVTAHVSERNGAAAEVLLHVQQGKTPAAR